MSNNSQQQTPPVLYIVFNRLETVKRSFEAIRQAAPRKFFIAADGPRDSHPEEDEICQAVRDYILNHIDWECEVKVRFQEKNLGCKLAVSSAVDWFFSEVEEGIILEDDCLPGKDFFRFAAAALEFYRDDPRVMHINGSCFGNPGDCGEYCGFLYRYAHVWGWASWRRAWKFYDVNLKNFTPRKMYEIFPDDRRQAARWNEILKNVITDAPGFNTWDFQWTYTVMINGAWCVSPVKNLVSNIGTEQSPHDMDSVSNVIELFVYKMPEKLLFPVRRDPEIYFFERKIFNLFWKKSSFFKKVCSFLSSKLKI